MRFLIFLASLYSLCAAQDSGPPGYTCYPKCIEPTIPTSTKFDYGRHYAVLNLDLMNVVVGSVNATAAGKHFISSTASWIDAVHAQDPPPVSIFTRIYFSNHLANIGPQSPFGKLVGSLGTASDPLTDVWPAFHVDRAAGDVVLQKTRYYAGAGNSLEQILSTQKIDTVILSGASTYGTIVTTAYRLYDLDYQVYVIANNTIETPPDGPSNYYNLLQGVLPKLPVNVITVEQALDALSRSGPAIY